LAKGHKIAKKGSEVYRLFRVVTAGIDPVSALIRELRIATTDHLLTESTVDLKRWLIDAYIKKLGYYAIELYSGNLILDDEGFRKPSRQTQAEIETLQQREKSLNAEPFRVLVVGQTNAGKASLINAIAQRRLAIVDAAPNPLDRQTYLIRRDDLPSTIIVDCQRYDDTQCQKQRLSVLQQAAKSDVVIIAISAASPVYQIDKVVLDGIKQLDNKPRIMVALTQIDKIRPLREWAPPYDLMAPRSAKAEAIRNAALVVADRLNIGFEQIIPLSLREGMVYNCQEQLIPALVEQFKRAEGKRHLRGIQSHQNDMRQKQLKTQLLNAGQWLNKTGFELAVQGMDYKQKTAG